MTERKEESMYQQAQRVHLSATSKAIAAAHDALLNTALDSVRWVRRGLLSRLKRDT